MLTKAERSARNKAAHAIRRAMADADYRQAKADGQPIAWRDIAATYDAISADAILAMTETTTTPATPAPVRRKRSAPAHVARARDAHRLAMEAWTAGLEDAIGGGHRDGRPARGEKYTDEERDYRAKRPCPLYRDFLAAEIAAMNNDAAMVSA
jgi:hypothetical protein